MVIDNKTLREIRKRGEIYNATKDKLNARIKESISIAINKLNAAENEILADLETEFKVNPFLEFLSNDNPTDEEIKNILEMEIPNNFGPDPESFFTLYRQIDSLRSWQSKFNLNYIELIPQNIRCTNIKNDSASFSWDSIKYDCIYEIESKSSTSLMRYRTLTPEYVLCDLKPETEYFIRVRSITFKNGEQDNWSTPIAVKTKSVTSGIAWKECPDYVDMMRKYLVDKKNPRIATKIGTDDISHSTIVWNTPLPSNTITSWDIKILRSKITMREVFVLVLFRLA